MRLARAAGGIVLLVALGGCHSTGRTVSAGKPAGATESAAAVGGQLPQPVCQPDEGIVSMTGDVGATSRGVDTPQQVLAESVARYPQVPATRFAVDSASSDSTHGPVHFVARTNGNVRAIVIAEKAPAGGWVGSEVGCPSFWRTGQ